MSNDARTVSFNGAVSEEVPKLDILDRTIPCGRLRDHVPVQCKAPLKLLQYTP